MQATFLHKWLNERSIATKLRLANFLTSGIVIFAAGSLLMVIYVFIAGESLLEQTRTDAAMTAENLTAAIVFNDPKSAADILSTLKAFRGIAHARVRLVDGRVFAQYVRDPSGSIRPSTPLDADGHRFTLEQLSVSRSIAFKGRQLGTIRVDTDLAPLYVRLAWYVASIVIVMLGSLALAQAILMRLHRAVTAPLVALARTSKTISEKGDYSIRAEVAQAADLGLVTTAFNKMLDQIERNNAELIQEISERKIVEAKLDRLAHFDNVTGLRNRHFFHDRLQLVVERARRFQERTFIMFLDLDNFKAVNDTLGHNVGDELLKAVAGRLLEAVRFDDTVARIGGDEFAILLENAQTSEFADSVARKCVASLAHAFKISGHEIYISASIGVSSCPDDSVDIHTLMKFADTAMYYAKSAGKNTYRIFDASMPGEAAKRYTLSNELRGALERDEFVLYFQPQVDGRTLRTFGVEALIRWAHPEVGIIGPAEFISLAEESGLIVQIGEWVLRAACAQLKQWDDGGICDVRMSVNLSARQLAEEQFVSIVLGIVRSSGIRPEMLELELTESMLMDISAATLAKLDALRAAGMSLAIDDFGTGYSSMSALKRFPINTLKLDRSFVSDLAVNLQDQAITRAIISMAASLGMNVVAEGVETQEQSAILQANSCHQMQGYLFSKPGTAIEIGNRLSAEVEAKNPKYRKELLQQPSPDQERLV